MKTFRFIGKRTYVEYFKIDVEAETKEEAEEIIEEGDYEEWGHSQEMIGSSEEIKYESEIL